MIISTSSWELWCLVITVSIPQNRSMTKQAINSPLPKIFVFLFLCALFEGDHMVWAPHLLRWAPAGRARHTQRAPFDLNDPSKNRWKRCVQVNRSSPRWSLWLQRKTERQREKAQECALKQLCMPAQGHITCDEAGSPPAYAWCQLTPLPWKQYKHKSLLHEKQSWEKSRILK